MLAVMETRAYFDPWCAECGEPFQPDHEIVATVVRDGDGQIRSNKASLYHEGCFDQGKRPAEVRIIKGYREP